MSENPIVPATPANTPKPEEKKVKSNDSVTCECGKSVLKKNLGTHLKSKGHLATINKDSVVIDENDDKIKGVDLYRQR